MNITETPQQQINLGNAPVLQKIQIALDADLTRVWPTRYLPMCPPARAALVAAEQLQIPNLQAQATEKVLVVFLPSSLEEHLPKMIHINPTVRIHPDLSLLSKEAYASWSVPNPVGSMKKTLWIKVSDLLPSMLENDVQVGAFHLPLVFVAGQTVVSGEFSLTETQFADWERALANITVAPGEFSEGELSKARTKAARYSDRPWLLMMYELANNFERLAVSWAPVRTMTHATPI